MQTDKPGKYKYVSRLCIRQQVTALDSDSPNCGNTRMCDTRPVHLCEHMRRNDRGEFVCPVCERILRRTTSRPRVEWCPVDSLRNHMSDCYEHDNWVLRNNCCVCGAEVSSWSSTLAHIILLASDETHRMYWMMIETDMV